MKRAAWKVLSLLLLLLLALRVLDVPSQAAAIALNRAAKVITLSAPTSYAGGQRVPFQVRGDKLGATTLRVWRLVTTNGAQKQVAVFDENKRGANDLTFWVPLKSAGLYVATAKSGAASHTLMLKFTPVFARRWIAVSGQSGVPSKNVGFSVSGSSLKTAKLSVWRLEADAAPRQSLVYATSKTLKKNEYSLSFEVPLLRAGLYLAQISGGGLTSTTYVRISDVGLVTKRAPRELLVYAVRLTNGAPMPRAQVRVDDSGVQTYSSKLKKNIWTRKPQAPRALVAGNDGVVRFFNAPSNGTLTVTTVAPDGSRATSSASISQTDTNDLRVLFYTERPIYRPGQKVFFKGLVRRDLTARGLRLGQSPYAVVANKLVNLEITDAQNNTIEKLKLRTNAMGSFAGSTVLPDEAPVGRYSVETKIEEANATQEFYGRFSVQEYRKPEFEISATPLLDAGKSFALQGEDFEVRISARYNFGGAAKGAQVEYSGAATGTTTLDDNGEAIIKVANPTNMVDMFEGFKDTTRDLHFRVTDKSRRSVETDVSVFAPYAQVRPTLTFNKNIYQLQDIAQIEVTTRDPIGSAVSAKARLELTHFVHHRSKDARTLKWEETTEERVFFTQDVQTDAYGRARVQVRLGKAGYIKATVKATDALERDNEYSTGVWSLSKDQNAGYYGYEFPALQVLLDKESYVPNENVQALITTDKPGRSALITLQSDRIWFARVIKLTSSATPFSFRFPSGAAPGAHLNVGFVKSEDNSSEWVSTSSYIKAPDLSRNLNIQITPNKKQFRPGETAIYTISAKDGTGRPQKSEVSIGFVDRAIYTLANDETPNPQDFFYGPREDRVDTSYFLPRELQGGSYQRIERAVPVREKFEDTAYWNPFVTTNANGTATLKVAFPDNLTTWRATARGITTDTKVGSSTRETLVTKPLLVRLELPRFLVQDDRVEAQVIVQNNTASAQKVRVSLRGDGATTQASEETKGAQVGQIAAGGSQSFFWTVGSEEMPLSRNVSFTATARADGAAESFDDTSDAMKLTLPMRAHGVRVRQWTAGSVAVDAMSAGATIPVVADAIANADRLDINYAPTLAGPILDALPQLQSYPYGCTEQTLSRFVPTLVAARTLKTLGKPLPAEMKELPKMVAAGLKTLREYQHSDGGWGWWKDDDTDPFLTAYAIYGLSLAQEAGYDIDRDLILRGVRSLQNQFSSELKRSSTRSDANNIIASDTRAWMMLAFSTAISTFRITTDEIKSDDYLGAVFKVRDELSPYGLASLTAAYARAATSSTRETATLRGKALMTYLNREYKTKMMKGSQTYRSETSKRLYYRDQNAQPVFIDIPVGGLVVPLSAAKDLAKVEGYNLNKTLALQGSNANLQTLISQLEASAKTENSPRGQVTFWAAREDDKQSGGWMGSDIETTSLGIQALLRAKPQSEKILPAVRWLLDQRRGDLWESTKDSAQAVIALSDFLRVNQDELSPDETVRVLVNGDAKQSARFTSAATDALTQTLRVDGLANNANIVFEKSGRGAVYFSAQRTSFTRNGLDKKEDNGFQIERRYAVQNAQGLWRDIPSESGIGDVPLGVPVRVELRVSTNKPREYVLVEDNLPSGFELSASDDESAWNVEQIVDPNCDCKNITVDPPAGWARFPTDRREDHDDRVALFASYLDGDAKNTGQYLVRYVVRAESKGTRVALPARVETMYRPDINGRSSQNVVAVK